MKLKTIINTIYKKLYAQYTEMNLIKYHFDELEKIKKITSIEGLISFLDKLGIGEYTPYEFIVKSINFK